MSLNDLPQIANSFGSFQSTRQKKTPRRSVRLELPTSPEFMKLSPQSSLSSPQMQPPTSTQTHRATSPQLPSAGATIYAPTIFHSFPPDAKPAFVFDIVSAESSFPFLTNPTPNIKNPVFLLYTVCATSFSTEPIKFKLNSNTVSHWINDPRPIDATEFLAPFSQQNWLIVEIKNFYVPFSIIGIWASCGNMSTLISEIESKGKFSYSEVSAICPISGRQIDKPARGINCNHEQCFDAVAYITQAQAICQWECPVCKQRLPLDELRIGETPTFDLHTEFLAQPGDMMSMDEEIPWDF